MGNEMKTIGVLTSGGDAPGMNAAIRAVVRTGVANGIRMMGIYRGYNGLLEDGIVEALEVGDVADIIQRGGTKLYTARSEKFKEVESQKYAAEKCRKLGIDGLVCIGGDGTFRGAHALSKQGIPCIGIPGTIDNDIAASSYTIGYDTAMNTAMQMIDKLRDTAQSHDRCSVVELMGRHAGHIALNTGVACGATSILVPEIDQNLDVAIINKIKEAMERGKRHFIVVVAEGTENTDKVANYIHEKTGLDTRITVLGHVQRGGSPTVRDRVVASEMGNLAVNLLIAGHGNRVVVVRDDKIKDLDITEALGMSKTLDKNLLHVAYTLSR